MEKRTELKTRICSLSLLIFMLTFIPIYAQNNSGMSKQSGYAPVNGIQMYYEIHGTGSIPLVLIHGGGSTIESTFGTLLPMLSASYKVIAVELQAHGRTSD